MPGFKKGIVRRLSRPASTHVDVVFESMEVLNFQPGQFVSIRVNGRDVRSYSLAGTEGDNLYRLIVDVKPGGPGSQFFDHLKVGDQFEFIGPAGRFVYMPSDGAEEMLFLATGTGVAPFKAMIDAALSTGDTRKIALYFGLRFVEDIFWDDYFNQLQAAHANVRFVLCLSKPDERWKGVVGHITDMVKAEYTDLSHASAYLCGNGKMILEASVLLRDKNMKPERIYSEKFF